MRCYCLWLLGMVLTAQLHAQQPTTDISLYGFFMTDAGYDLDQSNPLWFDVVRPTQLPAYPYEYGTNGNIFFSVRQTRLGLLTSTPTGKDTLQGKFEFDMFGVGVNAGETTFHLRHAFVQYGRWGIGQTWSPFIDSDIAPLTLDYWGPIGMVFYRNIQLRYSAVRTPTRELNVALERPGASADESGYSTRIELQNVRPRFFVPDLSAEYKYSFSKGYIQTSGILRHIAWRDDLDDGYDLNGSALGWGLTVSTSLSLGKHTRFMGQFLGGKGFESCMNDAPFDIGIRSTGDSSPTRPYEGYALPAIGYFLGLEHHWNEKLMTSVFYSTVSIYNAPTTEPISMKTGTYILANLLYFPMEQLMIGAELQWAQRVNEAEVNGFQSSDQRRIQFSFKYSFSTHLR